jgi:hypothetical protein
MKLAQESIDLEDIESVSLSAIMRKLNKQNPESAIKFLTIYKSCFDFLASNGEEDIEDLCVQSALDIFSKLYEVSLSKKADDNSKQVAQYLANIIKFTLSRISLKNRQKSINGLKQKIYALNEHQIAGKEMPPSSSIGQAITFVKNILFSHTPQYIRAVLNNIVSYL